MHVVPCALLKKYIIILKKMVKKLNKKHCSHDAYKQWEKCFLFNFFTIILVLFYFFSIMHKEPHA